MYKKKGETISFKNIYFAVYIWRRSFQKILFFMRFFYNVCYTIMCK